MISTHICEFVVLAIEASFHKQSEGELVKVFCSKKKIDYLNNIRMLFLLFPCEYLGIVIQLIKLLLNIYNKKFKVKYITLI